MNQSQRLTIWIVMLTAVFALAGFWTYQYMLEQKRFAQVTANNVLECQTIAKQIEKLRTKTHDDQPVGDMNTLVQLIQQSASLAGMPMNHVQRIRPSSARRIGQTPYIENPTQLSLNQVTMKDTVSFLHHLASNQPSLQIQSLRLTDNSGRQPTPEEAWQVEVGLASITYEPIKKETK